jgi:hypothetical protein
MKLSNGASSKEFFPSLHHFHPLTSIFSLSTPKLLIILFSFNAILPFKLCSISAFWSSHAKNRNSLHTHIEPPVMSVPIAAIP